MTLTADSIVKLERDSIEAFVLSCRDAYRGRVLDYGAGLQPYRLIVLDHIDLAGEYVAHDRAAYPANVSVDDLGPPSPLEEPQTWDAILCTQSIQYWPDPYEVLCDMREALREGGHLVLTGPTNWRELEADELWRFTIAGIRYMLVEAGFEVLRLERRAVVEFAPGFEMSLGYGCLARA